LADLNSVFIRLHQFRQISIINKNPKTIGPQSNKKRKTPHPNKKTNNPNKQKPTQTKNKPTCKKTVINTQKRKQNHKSLVKNTNIQNENLKNEFVYHCE